MIAWLRGLWARLTSRKPQPDPVAPEPPDPREDPLERGSD